MKAWAKNKSGFTIVELLIVIVVIAILATITVVAFNGVQQSAKDAAYKSELSQAAKTIMRVGAIANSSQYTTIDAMPGGPAEPKLDMSKYRVVTYCTNGTSYVLAAETVERNVYYAQSNTTIRQDNALDVFFPCATLGVPSADTTYLNLPATVCALEGQQCSFSGTATVVYGSTQTGNFRRQLNATSPVACTNTTFGDPASGLQKRCYVYAN